MLPKHVAVIMDGNGRWAQKRMLPRVAGHRKAIESVRKLVKAAIEYKIPFLTLFAFSSENWQRPVDEVAILMSLVTKLLKEEIEQLNKNKVKLKVIGDRSSLSQELQAEIQCAENKTFNNTALQLTIALSYGGKWDIVQAVKTLCQEVNEQKRTPDSIDEKVFTQYLQLEQVPAVDLLIRSGGELRISNFLLWHLAYAELFFTDILWPDFCRKDFEAAIKFYQARERRFGQVKSGTLCLEKDC